MAVPVIVIGRMGIGMIVAAIMVVRVGEAEFFHGLLGEVDLFGIKGGVGRPIGISERQPRAGRKAGTIFVLRSELKRLAGTPGDLTLKPAPKGSEPYRRPVTVCSAQSGIGESQACRFR